VCSLIDPPKTYPDESEFERSLANLNIEINDFLDIRVLGKFKYEFRLVAELASLEVKETSTGLQVWRASCNLHLAFSGDDALQMRLTDKNGAELSSMTLKFD